MAKVNEIYVCEACGNVVESMADGDGVLVCCSVPMKLQKAKFADSAVEKHVPVAELIDGGTKVKVGSVPHPMEEAHHICWIEIINGDYVNRKMLHSGQAPEAEFYVKAAPGMVLREYCNVHGLWEQTVK
ncbi:MAG: desulfoferrodoxin [Victivallales bacterium]|nr:desulfoferrodoxin [Victivallales bacterium]